MSIHPRALALTVLSLACTAASAAEGVGAIPTKEQGIATGFADQRNGAFTAGHIDIGNHYLQPLTGKGQGGGTTDTGSAAGDQGYFAGKIHAHCCILAGRWE